MVGSSFSPGSCLVLSTTIVVNQIKLPISAFVNSGEEQNLISSDLVDNLQITIQTLNPPLSVAGLTRQSLAKIHHRTHRLYFIISSNQHKEGEVF